MCPVGAAADAAAADAAAADVAAVVVAAGAAGVGAASGRDSGFACALPTDFGIGCASLRFAFMCVSATGQAAPLAGGVTVQGGVVVCACVCVCVRCIGQWRLDASDNGA